MVDQATVQTKVAYGLGIAAKKLGSPYQQYRPTTASNPLSGNPLQTLYASFDADANFGLGKPPQWGKPFVYGLFDTTQTQLGDYLVGTYTVFVSQFDPIRPALCVICNHTLVLSNPKAPSSPGMNPYGGRTTTTDAVLDIGWPASVLTKTRGDNPVTRLPSDMRAGYYEVLLPPIPSTVIQPTMRLLDENGTSYVIATAEQSGFGWRLLASVATT